MTYVISDLYGEEIVGTFCEKQFQITNQKEFKIEKIMKRIQIETIMKTLKASFASLKTDSDKLHIDKLLLVPVGLSKLSDVVKNNVVKKLFMAN